MAMSYQPGLNSLPMTRKEALKKTLLQESVAVRPAAGRSKRQTKYGVSVLFVGTRAVLSVKDIVQSAAAALSAGNAGQVSLKKA